MQRSAQDPAAYLAALPVERRHEIERVRALIRDTLPDAEEGIHFGMLGYAYRGRPFAALAAHKNYLSLYLMDLYTQPELRVAHAAALAELDLGKSCIRFRRASELPFATLAAILRAAPAAVVRGGTLAGPGPAGKTAAKKPAARGAPVRARAKPAAGGAKRAKKR